MTIRVTLEGDEDLIRKLHAMGLRVQDLLEPAVQAAAELVRDDARGMAPGPAIEQEKTRATRTLVEVSVGPDRRHWYYRFLESGTAGHGPARRRFMVFNPGGGLVFTGYVRGTSARPFLRPAADSNEDAAADKMGSMWSRAIESV